MNYKKFVTELNLDQFTEKKYTVKCHCSEYITQFLNNERGHFPTGSLKIIKNNKLRKLFLKDQNIVNLNKLIRVVLGKRLKQGLKILLKTYLRLNVLHLTIFKIGNFLS